jgi:uncharacterized damage-inducible protein DinB
MKKSVILLLLFCAAWPALGQDQKGATDLRGILLEQLRTTHNKADWFVPINTAVEGMTAEQANWSPGHGGHSVGQLAYHILFWDREQLAKFEGKQPEHFDGNNDETFNNFDGKKWESVVKGLDEVMTEWEKDVEAADDQKLAKWASAISHVTEHNAYHVGQILYVRKLEGSWDAKKGVH